MEYVSIGKIYSSHGLEGELNIQVHERYAKYLNPGSFIFVGLQKGSHIPYRIMELQPLAKDKYCIEIQNIEDMEAAKQLINKPLYLHTEQMGKHMGEDKMPQSIVGFVIVDQNLGRIGEVNALIETPGQLLAQLQYEGREILIPMSEDWIIDVLEGKKQVLMELPDGLLEL